MKYTRAGGVFYVAITLFLGSHLHNSDKFLHRWRGITRFSLQASGMLIIHVCKLFLAE
jgi:hypothetical protein